MAHNYMKYGALSALLIASINMHGRFTAGTVLVAVASCRIVGSVFTELGGVGFPMEVADGSF